jgi:hypothetical protein
MPALPADIYPPRLRKNPPCPEVSGLVFAEEDADYLSTSNS